MIDDLLAHTSYLSQGFMVNLTISAVSMAVGTLIGALLARLRAHGGRVSEKAAGFMTNICRNVPSFVLLFYMAFMIPSELVLAGQVLAVPLWIKASLALTFPVIGFVSDQALAYLRNRRADPGAAAETFWVAWVQYLLIIIMASATASVIGADEIVGRANTLIALNNDPQFLFAIYLYVSLWFIVSGLVLSVTINRVLKRTLRARRAH